MKNPQSSRTGIALVFFLLLGWQVGAAAETRTVSYDLHRGTLFHNEPTFTHPVDPPTAPNGEIEDNYFSDTMRFAPVTLSDAPGSNSVRVVVNFVNADDGATQRLRLDAKGTGSPFPETFALRFPGEPTHATIGPGMFLTSSDGTVAGVGDGTLEVTLTGVARSPGDAASPPNPYSVPLRCFIDDCDTQPHFPESRDLTDDYLTFTGLVLDVTLDSFEGCSVSRPDCDGISFDGFSFAMLAGDISISEPDHVVPLDFDLNDGTFNRRDGSAEDSYLSGPISFDPVTLASGEGTVELQIRFRDEELRTLQSLEVGALGTGFNRPETFASRLPEDPCFDDGQASPGEPCGHSGGPGPTGHFVEPGFGPGMVVSNSGGAPGDGSTTMQTTVSLRGPGGTFADDFINPYVGNSLPDALSDPVSLCGHTEDDVCVSGPHFPDLVDGSDVASFRSLVVDLEFDSISASPAPVTLNTFEFNMLGGFLNSSFYFLPLPTGVSELLERLADPLSPFPSLFPLLTFASGNSVEYDADSDLLSVHAVPMEIRLSQGADPVSIASGAGGGKELSIDVMVDETGSLVGGLPGDDMRLVGAVDLGALGAFSGELLTGEVSAFNPHDLDGATDVFEFLITPTGGELAFLYADQTIGISVASETSTFSGDFGSDFGGEARGILGNALPNAQPVVDAGSDQTVECSGPAGAEVLLDGSVSFDPDGDALTFTWSGPFGSVSGETVTVTLPVGVHDVTLQIEDGEGGVATDSTRITVGDTLPPELDLAVSPDVLWPPDHRLVAVEASVVAADVCDTQPTVRLVSITSNEPDGGPGSGNTANDIQSSEPGTDDRSFELRAERSGAGEGRTYTIVYEAEDATGNISEAQATVSVPLDQRRR